MHLQTAMHITLGEISKEIDGVLIGSPDKIIRGIALIDDATSNQITLVAEKRTLQMLHQFEVGAVIVPANYDGPQTNIIKVDDPQLAFAKAIALFHPKKSIQPEISSLVKIHSSATLGKDVFIGPFTSIGPRAIIGDRVVIQAGSHIDEDVFIDDDTALSYNVVILSHTQVSES